MDIYRRATWFSGAFLLSSRVMILERRAELAQRGEFLARRKGIMFCLPREQFKN